jgi:hypothetical protein
MFENLFSQLASANPSGLFGAILITSTVAICVTAIVRAMGKLGVGLAAAALIVVLVAKHWGG